jgi:hypothetical protein
MNTLWAGASCAKAGLDITDAKAAGTKNFEHVLIIKKTP